MTMIHFRKQQRGVVLGMVLLWLILGTLLVLSAVNNALQEQKAARSYRDRAIAFQSAEAGLIDAEADIEQSPSPTFSRSDLFAINRSDGFPQSGQTVCQQGHGNHFQGMCRSVPSYELLTLLAADVNADVTPASPMSVEYGRFTGRYLQTAGGSLPARLPRYLIELVPDPRSRAGAPLFIYRITAIGFGPQADTQVVLQSLYRKGVM